MSYSVIPFKAEHYLEVHNTYTDYFLKNIIDLDKVHLLEDKYAVTILHDNTILMCGGIDQIWNNRGHAWAILTEHYKKHIIKMVYMCRKIFQACPYKRIESPVVYDDLNSHRWHKTMGFKLEIPLIRHFFPNGEDAAIYSIIKE